MLKNYLSLIISLLLFFNGTILASAQGENESNIYNMTQEEINVSNLFYYSDRISFIGYDTLGTVNLMIHCNRGSDGDEYQAYQNIVLHDDKKGWVEILGNGEYPNEHKQTQLIPDSEHFTYLGSFNEGFDIKSSTNDLKIKIDPVSLFVAKQKGLSQFLMGNSQAELSWGDRTITGRVIYEALYLPGVNPLSQSNPEVLNDFQAVYLSLDGLGDLYFHTQTNPILTPLIGERFGFVVVDNQFQVVSKLDVKVTSTKELDNDRLIPNVLDGSFNALAGKFKFTFDLTDEYSLKDVNDDGFYMSIVDGSLDYNGRVFNVTGLSESAL